MATSEHSSIPTTRGGITVHTWPNPAATWIAILVHGYGEHLGRYDHVADRLARDGAVVLGPDHQGHGRSDGEPVSIDDFETLVDDLHLVVDGARRAYAGLPLVMIGHSMGGMIGTRYAQRFGDDLAALVLSGPVLGSWVATDSASQLGVIPDDPLDVSTLSRDPAVGEAYAADPLVWHGPFKRETLLALRAALETINVGGDLGSLPTLWVHGEADALVPIDATREGIARIKGSDLTEVIYPDARHEVFNETNREDVLAAVASFALTHVG